MLSSSIYGCQQIINPQEFERVLDTKHAEVAAYFNEFARVFRTDDDPVYQQHKAEFENCYNKIAATLDTIRNTPTQSPDLLCSEQTQREIYPMIGIKPEDSHKPILINRPGMGMNASAVGKFAMFLDENYHRNNKDTRSNELCFKYNHENGHILKYQPDEFTLKNIKFAELYIKKVQEVPIYEQQRPILAQLIESVQYARKLYNYSCEWGADLHATKVCSQESVQQAIQYYRSLNLPSCSTHPDTKQRADIIECFTKKPSNT